MDPSGFCLNFESMGMLSWATLAAFFGAAVFAPPNENPPKADPFWAFFVATTGAFLAGGALAATAFFGGGVCFGVALGFDGLDPPKKPPKLPFATGFFFSTTGAGGGVLAAGLGALNRLNVGDGLRTGTGAGGGDLAAGFGFGALNRLNVGEGLRATGTGAGGGDLGAGFGAEPNRLKVPAGLRTGTGAGGALALAGAGLGLDAPNVNAGDGLRATGTGAGGGVLGAGFGAEPNRLNVGVAGFFFSTTGAGGALG